MCVCSNFVCAPKIVLNYSYPVMWGWAKAGILLGKWYMLYCFGGTPKGTSDVIGGHERRTRPPSLIVRCVRGSTWVCFFVDIISWWNSVMKKERERDGEKEMVGFLCWVRYDDMTKNNCLRGPWHGNAFIFACSLVPGKPLILGGGGQKHEFEMSVSYMLYWKVYWELVIENFTLLGKLVNIYTNGVIWNS